MVGNGLTGADRWDRCGLAGIAARDRSGEASGLRLPALAPSPLRLLRLRFKALPAADALCARGGDDHRCRPVHRDHHDPVSPPGGHLPIHRALKASTR